MIKILKKKFNFLYTTIVYSNMWYKLGIIYKLGYKMIGIRDIAYYICENRENNINKIFNGETVDEDFVKNKIGIEQVSRKKDDENTSDLCIQAYNRLKERNPNIDINNIDLICVCTQNSSFNDIINVIDFYLSPKSFMITGQTIYLGGIS